MQLYQHLILMFLVMSIGRCQFVTRSYSPSIFEKIELGQPPNGVYIPQDSFLNVLRNPSYRSNTQSVPTSPSWNNQQNLYVQPPTSRPMPQQNANLAPVMADPSTPSADRMQDRVSRRTIRRTERVSGTPQTYSPSTFQNIGFGEVPPGVYVPPDSLLNVLRNGRNSRTQEYTQDIPANNNNFGLLGNNGNGRQQRQQFFVQQPTNEDSVMPKPILPVVHPDVQYAAPSPTYGDGEYGAKLRPHRRQRLQRSEVKPPSMALDPSMEYPADVPREEMQALPRSNVEYVDFRTEMEQNNNVARKPKRRQYRKKRIQTGVKPDYVEPEYPPRVYGPSEFQNIGLGEPPSGIAIPSDSMLNLLRGTRRQSVPAQTSRTEDIVRPAPISESYLMEEMSQPQMDPQMPTTRRRSRQRSRQENSSEMEITREYGSRTSNSEPIQTFRESSQQRRMSHRRS